MNTKLAPGVYKVDDGAQKLAAGAVQLSAALTPTPAGNAENNLADGATRLNNGAAQLNAGAVQLAAGTNQLKGYRGANNNPEAGTGTAALAQALELLQTAADDPIQGLVPLSVVKDKIAKIAAGAHKLDEGATQLQSGASRLQAGAGQLDAGTGKLSAGFGTLSGKLNSQDPGSPGVVLGTRLLADGTAKIRVGMDGVPGDPEHPGLLKAAASMTDGTSRLADGTLALSTGIQGDPGDPANPGLLNGSKALAAGASDLSSGNTKLAAGSSQLASGADKLADGNARIAAGTDTLHSSAAAISPASMVGTSDVATALGLVGVLGLGSVAAFLLMRKKNPLAETARSFPAPPSTEAACAGLGVAVGSRGAGGCRLHLSLNRPRTAACLRWRR
ncbi:hypothetical protein AHiyo6_31580 [Arthrobacter sp. Hiyo6]|nr:hypothetical protein AHiyo6_31580 [Arthrobacter sp. Hiyo6]